MVVLRIIHLKKGVLRVLVTIVATVATFEVNPGLCEWTVIIAMSLLHIQ